MLCRNPFMVGATPAGCGGCKPCRINKNRLWSNRIMLEATQHEHNSFVTLTYSGELPGYGFTLFKRDYQLFLKNLRQLYPNPLRYYLCGEYGEENRRAHYHAILFGYPSCLQGQTVYKSSISHGQDCCLVCLGIFRAWGLGRIQVGTVTEDSASYVCAYVTKGLTRPHGRWLSTRHPEFSKMSLKPGIGAPAMPAAALALKTAAGYRYLQSTGDVPSSFLVGRSPKPLGLYLKRKLLDAIAPAGYVPPDPLLPKPYKPPTKYQKEMLALQAAARLHPKLSHLSQKETVIKTFRNRAESLEKRTSIYSSPRPA